MGKVWISWLEKSSNWLRRGDQAMLIVVTRTLHVEVQKRKEGKDPNQTSHVGKGLIMSECSELVVLYHRPYSVFSLFLFYTYHSIWILFTPIDNVISGFTRYSRNLPRDNCIGICSIQPSLEFPSAPCCLTCLRVQYVTQITECITILCIMIQAPSMRLTQLVTARRCIAKMRVPSHLLFSLQRSIRDR
jgi:hypothetical protein